MISPRKVEWSKHLVTHSNWSIGTLHSLGDLFAALLSQVASVPDTKAMLEDFLDLL